MPPKLALHKIRGSHLLTNNDGKIKYNNKIKAPCQSYLVSESTSIGEHITELQK